MSYVMSGIGAAAAEFASMPPQLPASASYAMPPAQSRNTNGPAPGDKFIAVRNTNGPAPGDAFVSTPVRTAVAPTLAPSIAPATASPNWVPWAIGAVVLGGGLYLLFR